MTWTGKTIRTGLRCRWRRFEFCRPTTREPAEINVPDQGFLALVCNADITEAPTAHEQMRNGPRVSLLARPPLLGKRKGALGDRKRSR